MGDDEKRDALIFGLENNGKTTNTELQQFPTKADRESLVGFAYITTFLKLKRIKTRAERESRTYEDQRNALIVAVSKRGELFSIPYLQSLGDIGLYNAGAQVFGM